MDFAIHTTAFDNNAEIPRVYSCEGENRSPPLSWSDIPAGTKSLVLVVHDPDAPSGDYVHWIVYNIPPESKGLSGDGGLPAEAKEGMNSARKAGYVAPCPPSGRHRYIFQLYALDTVLPDLHAPNRNRLEKAMQGHIIKETEMIGLYQHSH